MLSLEEALVLQYDEPIYFQKNRMHILLFHLFIVNNMYSMVLVFLTNLENDLILMRVIENLFCILQIRTVEEYF